MGKKNDEEQVETIVEKIQNVDKEDFEGRKELAIILGFLLHPNMIIHLALSFFIALASLGLVHVYGDLIKYNLYLFDGIVFLIGVALLFTLIDYLIKYFFIRFLPKVMAYTLGLIFFLFYFLIFFLLDIVMRGNFTFIDSTRFIVFVFSFGIIKLILSIATRRIAASFILKRSDK